MDKVKKNYFIYILYQAILLSFPLITFPYVSGALGVNNYGIYNYSFTIVTYFLIFARLGIFNYGAREIAENILSRERLTKSFRNIFVVQFILTSIILLIYVLFCFTFLKDNLEFSLIYCIFLFANYFELSWFLQGVQDFNGLALRDFLVAIIQTPLIFLIIKNEGDLYTYAILLAVVQVIGNLLIMIKLRKYISFKCLFGDKLIDFKKHFIGMLILFVPILATNIYTLMDEIMLGNLSVMGQVGIYAVAKRIMYIPLAFITPLAMTMLPYISEAKSKGEKVKQRDKENTLLFTFWIGIACAFGLHYISSDIINIFFTEEYKGAIVLIQIMAFYSFFYVIAVLLRDVYFLPNHKDKQFVLTVVAGIPINLTLNILLIPKIGAMGAAFSTLISEGAILMLRLFLIRKELNWKYIIKSSAVFFFSAVIMYCSALVFDLKTDILIVDLIIDILLCILVYFMLTGDIVWKMIKR